MRFVLILAALGVATLAGLFVYGSIVQPDPQTIVEEVRHDAQ